MQTQQQADVSLPRCEWIEKQKQYKMQNAKCKMHCSGRTCRKKMWSLGQYSSPPPHSILGATGVQPGVVSTSSNPISQFSELQGNGVFCSTRECSAGECSGSGRGSQGF